MKNIYIFRSLKWISFLIVPLIYFCCVQKINESRGPRWLLENLDPDYLYLINSLNIALQNDGIGHFDNPGTPLQIAGALVIRVKYMFRETTLDLKSDVLTYPEEYLSAISNIITLINFSLLFLYGLKLFAVFKNILPAFLSQLATLYSFELFKLTSKVAPEAMLMAVTLCLLFLLVKWIHEFCSGEQEIKKPVVPGWLSAGFIIGLGSATKVTFLPLIFLPIILFKKRIHLLFYLLAVAASFFLFTLPMYKHYSYFASWLIELFKHDGFYGQGNTNIVDFDIYLNNIKSIFANNIFVVALMIIVCITVYSFRNKLHRASYHMRVGMALIITCTLAICVMAKHYAPRYLLPAFMSVTSISVFFILYTLRKLTRQQYYFVVLYGLFVLQLVTFRYIDLKELINNYNVHRNEKFTLFEVLDKSYSGCSRFFFQNASAPQFALVVANRYSKYNYSEDIKEIYKDEFYYQTEDIFESLGKKKIKLQELIANKKIIFQGNEIPEKIKMKAKFKCVFNGSTEKLFIIE